MPIEIAVFGPHGHMEVSGIYERRECNWVLCKLGIVSPFGLYGHGTSRYTYGGELGAQLMDNNYGDLCLALREHPAYLAHTLHDWYMLQRVRYSITTRGPDDNLLTLLPGSGRNRRDVEGNQLRHRFPAPQMATLSRRYGASSSTEGYHAAPIGAPLKRQVVHGWTSDVERGMHHAAAAEMRDAAAAERFANAEENAHGEAAEEAEEEPQGEAQHWQQSGW